MIIENLFPIPIGMLKYEDGITAAQESFLLKQDQRPNEGNTSSVDKYILNNVKMKNLKAFLEKSIDEYFHTTLRPRNEAKLRITQSWLNWTKPGQHHHKHAHPNSFISGCYYVNANKETDKIYFYRSEHRHIKFPTNDWNPYNSDSWWYPVGSGDIILFPSDLSHMVETVGGEDTRVSLAFNTFPVGYIGEENELTALHLEK